MKSPRMPPLPSDLAVAVATYTNAAHAITEALHAELNAVEVPALIWHYTTAVRRRMLWDNLRLDRTEDLARLGLRFMRVRGGAASVCFESCRV